jgi:N-acetylglucosamine-6-phosphate deacetylase
MEHWTNMGTTTWISGIDYHSNKHIQLEVKDGIIVGKIALDHIVREAGQEGSLPMIAPGLIDLQINGFKGIDFNVFPLTVEAISQVTNEVLLQGVTSYFPTVITNSDDHISAALQVIAEACRSDHVANDCIPGVHLEGPFISIEDGPRGAHNRLYVRPPNWEQFERWQDCADGRIKLITLSPEWEEAESFIRKCVDSGVMVSIGHTAANPEQIDRAVSVGATLSTHLGNGAHLQLARHPNYIWEQLAQDGLYASVIADGFHLPDSVLKVIHRVKGEHCILVSDSAALAGMPPGRYHAEIGGDVVLAASGRLYMADNERYLAGSAQMLLFGIEHLLLKRICELAEAWDMASIRPARLMRLDELAFGLEVGKPADIVLFNWNGNSLDLQQVYKRGVEVKTSNPA